MTTIACGPVRLDPEFRSLVPPPSADELAQLEANLLADGCRDPLVVWDDAGGPPILLDGHNRHAICSRRGLDYETVAVDLPDRDAAKVWIIRNQLGRRNITSFVRVELALKLEPLIAARAKANQSHGQTAPGRTLPQNSAEALETRDEIAKAAGVSHDTVAKVKVIEGRASERIKEKLRAGDVSIAAAAEVATLPVAEQESLAAAGAEAVRARAKEVRRSRISPARPGEEPSSPIEDDRPAATPSQRPKTGPEPVPTVEIPLHPARAARVLRRHFRGDDWDALLDAIGDEDARAAGDVADD
jgi:hypothetical protein